MSIEDFKYYWRFSDEKYAVLSKQELSTISVISKDEVEKEWIRICEKEIFQESAYINDIVHHSAPVLKIASGERMKIKPEKLLKHFLVN